MANEQLWAPWRLGYIQGNAKTPPPQPEQQVLAGGETSCFLCQAAATQDDRQRLVIHRSEQSLTVLNRYPYNNGHLLVTPRRHVARLDQLEECEQFDLTRMITRMIGALEAVLKPAGFNVGLNLGHAAGAGVPGHVHWHIVPRWPGDTNFMPVLAGIRVIPQSLDALWEALSENLRG